MSAAPYGAALTPNSQSKWREWYAHASAHAAADCLPTYAPGYFGPPNPACCPDVHDNCEHCVTSTICYDPACAQRPCDRVHAPLSSPLAYDASAHAHQCVDTFCAECSVDPECSADTCALPGAQCWTAPKCCPEHMDPCVSVCDGYVDHEAYEECGGNGCVGTSSSVTADAAAAGKAASNLLECCDQHYSGDACTVPCNVPHWPRNNELEGRALGRALGAGAEQTTPHTDTESGCTTPTLVPSHTYGSSSPGSSGEAPSPAFRCHWGDCARTFHSSEALAMHVHQDHLPSVKFGAATHEKLHANGIQHNCAAATENAAWSPSAGSADRPGAWPGASVSGQRAASTGAASSSEVGAAPSAAMPKGHFTCPWDGCVSASLQGARIGDTPIQTAEDVQALLQHLYSAHLDLEQPFARAAPDGLGVVAPAELKAPAAAPDATEPPCPCPPSAEGRKKHPCGWVDCSQSFSTHAELNEHIVRDHVGSGKRTYVCGWAGCPRAEQGHKYTQKQKVLRHIQTHTGYRPHQCPVCQRCFSEPNTLTQHMRTHSKERPYKCDFPGCNKAFSVAGSLTIHRRVHSGDRPFRCPVPGCEKAFSESSNLNKHLRVHRGEKSSVCPDCGRRFTRPDQLARHRRTHQKNDALRVEATGFAQPPGSLAPSDNGPLSGGAFSALSI